MAKVFHTSRIPLLLLLCMIYASFALQGNSELLVLGSSEIPFDMCGPENEPIAITKIEATPWPIEAGHDITLRVTANVNKEIAQGNYEAKVSFDGLQVIDTKNTLQSLGLSLPLPVGVTTLEKAFAVPRTLPAGEVQLVGTASTPEGEQLTCVSITLDLPDASGRRRVEHERVPLIRVQ